MLITPLLSNTAGPDFPRLEWTDVVCVLLAFTWGQEPGPGSSLRGDGRGETGKEKESTGGGRRLQDIRETKQGRRWWAQKSNTEERLVFNVLFSYFDVLSSHLEFFSYMFNRTLILLHLSLHFCSLNSCTCRKGGTVDRRGCTALPFPLFSCYTAAFLKSSE